MDFQIQQELAKNLMDAIQEIGESFIGSPVSEEIKQQYLNLIIEQFRQNELVDMSMVDISVHDDGTTLIIKPNNFFTALLLRGIYMPPVYVSRFDAYMDSTGVYIWDNDHLVHRHLEHIFSEVTQQYED